MNVSSGIGIATSTEQLRFIDNPDKTIRIPILGRLTSVKLMSLNDFRELHDEY